MSSKTKNVNNKKTMTKKKTKNVTDKKSRDESKTDYDSVIKNIFKKPNKNEVNKYGIIINDIKNDLNNGAINRDIKSNQKKNFIANEMRKRYILKYGSTISDKDLDRINNRDKYEAINIDNIKKDIYKKYNINI